MTQRGENNKKAFVTSEIKKKVCIQKSKMECYLYKDHNQGITKALETQSRVDSFFKSTVFTNVTQMAFTEKKKK